MIGRKKGSSLSPEEWETRLVQHFLRTDGPFGGTPLSWMDATPAELAIVSDSEGISDADAQAEFMAQFTRPSVQDCLGMRRIPPPLGWSGPGYFRYLVLTCLVSATDEGAGETRDFRKRLGELVDGDRPIQAVWGVNELWRSLVEWCDRGRELGQPFREIALPNPGNMSLIGYAVRMAFPSWSDRSALTRVLRGLPDSVRRSPQRLVDELERPHHRFSSPLLRALQDFSHRVGAGSRLLGGHRFWRLVESIEDRLENERGDVVSARWRLEVTFGGWEQDHVEVKLLRLRRRGLDPSIEWAGIFGELLALDRAKLPNKLVHDLDKGILIFTEAPAANWRLEATGTSLEQTAVVVARVGTAARESSLNISWKEIGGGWAHSGRLDANILWEVAERCGFSVSGHENLVMLSFDGGVATRRGSWLGRPGFLPFVCTSPDSVVEVQPIAPTVDELIVENNSSLRSLSTDAPSTGRWTVTAHEPGIDSQKRVLVLEAEVPERWEWPPEDVRWEPETELIESAEKGVSIAGALEDSEIGPPARMEDVLEALYAFMGAPRGEGEILKLLEEVLPRPFLVWDVLRSLAEAGWMEPRVFRTWKARRWRLCSPSLVVLGRTLALVEGATGTRARHRLATTAARLGGLLHSRCTQPWSAPVYCVTGSDPRVLAEAMRWPLIEGMRPELAAAPACWPNEIRSPDARALKGVWNFDFGRFEPVSGDLAEPRLERLVQDSDRDLYRVIGRSGAFLTTSRTVSILEAHRQAQRALFRWCDGAFIREGQSGHLPLGIGRSLRRATLSQVGPVCLPAGRWSYRYPADEGSAAWVKHTLGAAVSAPASSSPQTSLAKTVARRRAGYAPSWWTPSGGVNGGGRI